MDWKAAYIKRLLADGPIAALVGARVYWLERPQTTNLPAITLQTITDARAQHFRGFQSLQMARVQVDAWASSFASASSVSEAVIAALVPAHTGNGHFFERSFLDDISDSSERQGEATIYRVRIDFIIHHRPA